jgi:hypothetical protein
MNTLERNRHNGIVMQVYTAIAQVRRDIDEPGYNKKAASILREIGRLAYGEAHALDPEVKG